MRIPMRLLTLSCVFLAVAVAAQTQKKETTPKAGLMQKTEMTDAQYTAKALSAAPKAIADGAAVMRMNADGSMKTLRKGSNGFTCMVMGTDRMCADANSMEFMDAVVKKTAPPEKLGIAYMLAGDEGASNTDPYATGKTADNHWVVTGPHLMVFSPGVKALGYPDAKDADPSKPYIMWPGTQYAHVMVPVGAKK